MALLLEQYGDIYIFTNTTGQDPSVTLETTESGMYFISNICFLQVPVELFWIMMTPIFQLRCTIMWQISSTYDSSVILMDSDFPGPLSGGMRGLSLKYNLELSWNPALSTSMFPEPDSVH